MIFNRIQSSEDIFIQQMLQLYESAFPQEERRHKSALLKKIIEEPRFSCNAILSDDKSFLGLFNYWDFGRFCYVEHFAIEPNIRNNGIGNKVMSAFLNEHPICILEAELPTEDLSKRRLSFYNRLNFNVIKTDYKQPSYHNDGKLYPMYLLGTEGFDISDLDTMLQFVYFS